MFKRLNLKWKISIFTIIILAFIMTGVAYTIYNYTTEIVKEQVNNQIKSINNSQKMLLDNIINDLKRQIALIPEDNMVQSYTEMVSANKEDVEQAKKELEEASASEKDEAEKDYNKAKTDLRSLITGSGSLSISTGRNLNEQLSNIAYAEFAYITLTDGMVIADSRVNSINNRKNISNYLNKELPPEKYKDVKFGTLDYIDGKPHLLLNHPISDSREKDSILGYLVITLSPDLITEKLSTSLGDMGTITLINDQGFILNHENRELLGKKYNEQWLIDQIDENTESISEIKDNQYYILEKINGQDLYLTASVPLSTLLAPAQNIGKIILIITLVGLLITLVSVFLIIKWQLTPIDNLLQSFSSLENGNLSNNTLIKEKYSDRKDEIGKLATAFNSMVKQFNKLISDIYQAVQQLNNSTIKMEEAAEQSSVTAEQVGTSVENIASGAQEQSAQIDETQTNIQSLNKQISATRENSEVITTNASNVSESINKGNQSVKNSIIEVNNVKNDTTEIAGSIKSLGEITTEIGNIVDLINAISNQTNLLALNAAIEAARAGEAGRGFSVVADEIRELAEESASATEQIDDLIKKIQDSVASAINKMNQNEKSVNNSVKTIEKTGEIFNEIAEASNILKKSIDKVTQQNQIMAQESQEVENVIKNINQVSLEFASNSEEIAASSQEQTASIEEIASMSKELDNLATKLNKMIEKFNL